MTATPLVSIVIPVRNDRDGIARTLEAIRQLPINVLSVLECVVVDGGSTDSTLEVVSNFPTLVDHVLSGADSGVYDALNRGISLARGAWIWVLGAGDCPLADGTARWFESLAGSDRDVAWAATVRSDNAREAGVPERFTPRWDRSMWWRNAIHHQGLLAPRHWLTDHPFDATFRILGDYAWLLDMKRQSKRVTCVPDCEVARVGSGGLSRRFHAALYMEEWKAKQSRLPLLPRLAQPLWLPAKWSFKQCSRVLKSLGASTSQ